MDDKLYAKRALIVAVAAFVFATFPIIMPILMVFFDFRAKGCAFFERALAYLMLLGWIPGLVIAIIAHKMRQRMKGSILLINTTRNFVVLAMLGTLGFGIFEIFAMLLNHFAPRG